MDYAKYIRRCLQIARNGAYYVAPNPMVGAVLVRNADEKVLSEGWHQQYGGPHAEVNCLRTLPNPPYKGGDLGDCTLFVNLEPCS
ncbi:MAG: riboflavin biosynthesis protein RibD, partial [Paludibacteraceae bacterium]